MAELKTKPTRVGVSSYVASIKDEAKRKDCRTLVTIMKKATGKSPKMWGTAIVGFGDYHYKYATGREGDWFIVGFSPRAAALTLYLMGGLVQASDLLKKLGKYKTGKGCLYIKRLDDVNIKVLQELVESSVKYSKKLASGGA